MKKKHYNGIEGQKLIIYGGSPDILLPRKPASPDLAELDLATFKWKAPSVSFSNGMSDLPRLIYHAAAIHNDYMIISYGNLFFLFNLRLFINFYLY